MGKICISENLCLGHVSERKVVDITDQGAFVDVGVFGDLFVPHKQLPKDLKIGDKVRVCLYKDGVRELAN